MHLISNKALLDFAAQHPNARTPLQTWRKAIESRSFVNYADIKSVFGATDKAGDFYVFDVGGNKFRVIATINFSFQKIYIRHVFTHQEYNKWKP
ncbi:type II toxin-antitoxin system HigB family toxin [Massilia sp. BJB1822]|uniref:type II toxin-antitoxin system HigB family toxin n=1 Tax=Massilia sp. BJB1822 TaxID=2744470 RepID=UPI001592D024|nr:type II toxin-antitoxin system HigB family toxin [Massilia sp. BJB1822]NVD97637.1 type II toxin-antitoxin system HigB family toxin [Massilia sp. BJB1822]